MVLGWTVRPLLPKRFKFKFKIDGTFLRYKTFECLVYFWTFLLSATLGNGRERAHTRNKTQTAVTNICLTCITSINFTFRMLQHTSSEVIIIQLQINLNSKIQLYGLGTYEIDWHRQENLYISLLTAFSCRFMSIDFVSSKFAQSYFWI